MLMFSTYKFGVEYVRDVKSKFLERLKYVLVSFGARFIELERHFSLSKLKSKQHSLEW